MTQLTQALLLQANQAFRKKKYQEAYDKYIEFVYKQPDFESIVSFNIGLSKKRLNSSFDFKKLNQVIKDEIDILKLKNDPRLTIIKPKDLEVFYFDKIIESGLFDPLFYLNNYKDEVSDVENLLEHYLIFGVEKSLNPSAKFNTAHYLRVNPDVAQSGICPFVHYVCNGKEEGREALPKPYTSKYEVSEIEYIPRLPISLEPVVKTVRPICFYLPQYHAIPENDKWWGKGFTEWTNVKPAKPQFEGHYQPHVPHDDIGYYNLLERETQAKQIELAKQYGIEGFCYYYYWFSGQRLLEQPLDNVLNDPTLDLPFCVCWANENWSRRWDGLENDLLMVQNYSDEDDLAFIENVSKYLKDSRYIRVNDKPILLIYRPNLFPDMKATTKRWRDWCRENGIGEIYLVASHSFETVDPAVYDFDAAYEFPPNNSNPPKIIDQLPNINAGYQGMVYDWRIFLERSDNYQDPGYTLFRSATPSWDNTARKKDKGTVFHNSCPKLFTKNLVNVFNETIQKNDLPDERLVFINAWNEWAEGAHLEPDQRYGYAWLQSVYDAHQKTSQSRKRILVVSHDAHPHGAQILSMNFAKEFSQKLHFDVEMLVLGEGVMLSKFAQYANVQKINLDIIDKAELMQKLTALRKKSVDVAIVNTTVSGKLTPYLKQAGFSVVSLIHELPSVLNSMKLKEHAQAIAENADKIVFPAHQVQQGFETFIDKKLSQAVIKPQGIYLPSLLRQGADKIAVRNEVRANLSLASNAKIIMCAGYADHRKGFDYFVQACSDLIAKDPTIYALWVGHLDKPFVDASMQYAIQAGTDRHFIFTGLVDDPRKYYIAADIYALTSREDPFPSVVMEALDALTPVVAFKDCGGFENLLQHDCGILVAKDDVKAYAQALETILTNPALSAKLAFTGQQIVQSELSFYHYLFDLLDYAGQSLPRVSVAVPNYNYAKYIVSRLESIVMQTFPLYELIVLDDVSSDNSVEVITEYLQSWQIPYRLVVNEQNSGSVFKQWQKGAELAKGDYLWIAEADDLAEPKFVETLIKFFDDPEVVLAYSQSKQIDQDGNLLANDYLAYTDDIGDYWHEDYVISGEEEIKRALCIKNTIPNVSSVIFKREPFLAETANRLNDLMEFKVAGDWFIYAHLVSQSKIAFSSLGLNFHRRHIGSVTKKNTHLEEVCLIQNTLIKQFGYDNNSLSKISQWNEHLKKYFTEKI